MKLPVIAAMPPCEGEHEHLDHQRVLSQGPAGAFVLTDGLEHPAEGGLCHTADDRVADDAHDEDQRNVFLGCVEFDPEHFGPRNAGDPALPLRHPPGGQHEFENDHLETDRKDDEVFVTDPEGRKGQKRPDDGREYETDDGPHEEMISQVHADDRRRVRADSAEDGVAHGDDADIAHDQVQGLHQDRVNQDHYNDMVNIIHTRSP